MHESFGEDAECLVGSGRNAYRLSLRAEAEDDIHKSGRFACTCRAMLGSSFSRIACVLSTWWTMDDSDAWGRSQLLRIKHRQNCIFLGIVEERAGSFSDGSRLCTRCPA